MKLIINNKCFIVLFLFILLANVSCSSSSQSNNDSIERGQTEYRGNNQHIGIYDSKEVNFPLSLKWKYFNSKKGIVSAPVLSSGTIFFGSFDCNLYALDADNGNIRWKFKIPSSIITAPTVDDGTVFIGGMDGLLYAFSQETGEKKWSFETASLTDNTRETFSGQESEETNPKPSGDMHETQLEQLLYRINGTENLIADDQMLPVKGISSPPIVADGVVYFGTFGNRFYAVNALTGKELWVYRTNYDVDYCPTVINETVYFSTGHHLVALNGKTGNERWKIELINGAGATAISVGNQILYDDGVNLHAFSADTGKENWSVEVGNEIGPDGGPAVKDGAVFMGNDKGFYALDVLTGKKKWENSDIKPGSTGIPPAIAGNSVYYIDLEGGIVALDTVSGRQKGRYKLQGGFNPSWQTTTPMAIAEGVIYLGSMNGNLYAIQGS